MGNVPESIGIASNRVITMSGVHKNAVRSMSIHQGLLQSGQVISLTLGLPPRESPGQPAGTRAEGRHSWCASVAVHHRPNRPGLLCRPRNRPRHRPLGPGPISYFAQIPQDGHGWLNIASVLTAPPNTKRMTLSSRLSNKV